MDQPTDFLSLREILALRGIASTADAPRVRYHEERARRAGLRPEQRETDACIPHVEVVYVDVEVIELGEAETAS